MPNEDRLTRFLAPLHGEYDHEYDLEAESTRRLYEIGKLKNWNATNDVDWNVDRPAVPFDASEMGLSKYEGFAGLPRDAQQGFLWDYLGWHASQFLHGEQGALLVASQLVSCVPDMTAKLYAASQTFDEARHVEVFKTYIEQRGLRLYPLTRSLNRLLKKVLTDERWDIKLIGMQVIIEGIALASLQNIRRKSQDPMFTQIVEYVLKDEARHVNFGIDFLKDHLASLPQDELEQRAQFCVDACVVMRERFVPADVFVEYGWDVLDVVRHMHGTDYVLGYRDHLYRRLIPVLNRLGLITESTEQKYAMIGALDYKDLEVEA